MSQFLNREIGWLKFNERVLAQAFDKRVPLLERVKFLNIYHSNLDEFFMKRVGGLERQMWANLPTQSIDGLTAKEQLQQIRDKVMKQSEEIIKLLDENLIPELKSNKIHLLSWADLNDVEKEWATQFFRNKIFPVLTPIAVDQGHPFPLISNLSISLAVSLKNPNDEEPLFARIKIPRAYPVWIEIINQDSPAKEYRFISVIEIIIQHLNELFPKMDLMNVMTFRVTRNVDVDTSDEEAEDLLELITEEIKQRKHAEIVRIEHGPNPDPWLLNFLMEELEITANDVYEFPIKIEYRNLINIADINIPEFKYQPWKTAHHPQLIDTEQSIFNSIKANDILVHHPYESFNSSVERFVSTAATDPQVVAIKMSLYRTSGDGAIVNSLIKAAEMGKQVVCVIELKARFDEERNINMAQAMEKAGVYVVYGIVGLKTHAKVALVIRQEQSDFKTYAHIGTGNYNGQTAKLYTDFGLFTSNPDICRDVVEFFHYLTGRSRKSDYKKLLIAPINLRSSILSLINKERENAKKGLPAEIMAKMNSLEDKEVIENLYLASQDGVKITLIVRGFSCLLPGAPGLSENIRVLSVIGRFLEHSRVFYFRNGKKTPAKGSFYIGSADWMQRNLSSRVEVLVPIENEIHKMKLWNFFEDIANDQRLVWDMLPNGDYVQRQPSTEEQKIGVQEVFLTKAEKASQLNTIVGIKK